MQWIECERCSQAPLNLFVLPEPMIQPSKTANLRAAPGAARRMRNAAIGCEAVRKGKRRTHAKENAQVPANCGLER